jgi:hypothetical protein
VTAATDTIARSIRRGIGFLGIRLAASDDDLRW